MMPGNPWGEFGQGAQDATKIGGLDLLKAKVGGLGGLGGVDYGNVDMKSPLANFAMGMLQQELSKQNMPMQPPMHNMGMQPRQMQGALAPNPMQVAPLGRLYG